MKNWKERLANCPKRSETTHEESPTGPFTGFVRPYTQWPEGARTAASSHHPNTIRFRRLQEHVWSLAERNQDRGGPQAHDKMWTPPQLETVHSNWRFVCMAISLRPTRLQRHQPELVLDRRTSVRSRALKTIKPAAAPIAVPAPIVYGFSKMRQLPEHHCTDHRRHQSRDEDPVRPRVCCKKRDRTKPL